MIQRKYLCWIFNLSIESSENYIFIVKLSEFNIFNCILYFFLFLQDFLYCTFLHQIFTDFFEETVFWGSCFAFKLFFFPLVVINYTV